MNSSNLILFVLSLVFTIIKGDRNDSNTSITDRDIRTFMDDFANDLERLYTQNSKVVLDDIIDYFDEDDQEICIVAECYRKEMGNNDVRQYLKDNLMGKYHEAKITVKPKIRPSSSAELGYFVKVNTAKYLTEIINNKKLKCSSLSISQCIFLLNTDDDNNLYITKWIQISAPDSPEYDYDHDCESLGNDDNDPDCMPGAYCPVTNEADRYVIRIQLDSINNILKSKLAEYDIKLAELNLTIESMTSQNLMHGGKNINVTLGDSYNKIGQIIIWYYVSPDGELHESSLYIHIELNDMVFPKFPSTTHDDIDATDITDCDPAGYCDISDDEAAKDILNEYTQFIEYWPEQLPNADQVVSVQRKLMGQDSDIKLRFEDKNGDYINIYDIQYHVTNDRIDRESFKVKQMAS